MKKVFRIYMSVFLLGIILTACGGGGGGDGVLPADTSAPTVPTNLTASAVSASRIDLSWVASTDNVEVKGYKIYRGGTQVLSVAAISTSDTGLSRAAKYCYAVSAYDAAGNESALSEEVCATTHWTIQHGAVSDDLARGIAVDGIGNIYVAGYASGSLDGQTFAGGRDIFVVKYAADGSRKWTQQLGTALNDEAMGIALDTSGNVYVTGYTYGDLDGSNQGKKDLFVVKLTQNQQGDPTVAWKKQLGTAEDDWAIGIAADGSNVYVTGWTDGNLGDINQGNADIFVVKLTQADGTPVWIKQLGTVANEYANGIALDSSGNIYVTGYTAGDLVDTNQGGTDLFVVKLTETNGAPTVVWTKQLGTASDDVATGIALDSGNIYVTGLTYGGLGGNSNANTDPAQLTADIFVVKLTETNGVPAVAWTQQLGTEAEDWGNGIALDSSGNIYVTGYTDGGLDGNSNANPTANPLTADIFVVKYAADGSRKWTQQLGTVDNDWGTGIALDSSGGKIYATGGTCGNLDGNTSAGCLDFFVVQYAVDGTKQ